ncbi:MAG: DegT/DnrJ/EryC1/StrS family aminotransferase [Candidatus Coatesbacteria bacterium]
MAKLAVKGGPKACRVKWPAWPIWGPPERRALLGVLESGKWWHGKNVLAFERAFAAFQGARHGVTCNSGTAGLEAALGGLGVGPGDEVIVPAFTFIATASAVVRCGAKVVFADVRADNLCLDPDDVERKLGPRTRAIIPVHFCGNIADMDRLNAITRRKRLLIIEDACHAWGSRWRSKGAGALGTCGAFSFQISKNMTAGEGGIVLADDAKVAEKVFAFTHCGRRAGAAWYMHYTPATNSRMTEWQAAILLQQLKRLGAQTRRRQANARILDRGLGRLPGILPQVTDPRVTRRAYHMYCFRLDLDVLGIDRASFLSALSAEGVPCMPAYGITIDENPLFTGRDGGAGIPARGASCPEAQRAAKNTCWINHQNLLAPAAAMHRIVYAAEKVVANLHELRRPGSRSRQSR